VEQRGGRELDGVSTVAAVVRGRPLVQHVPAGGGGEAAQSEGSPGGAASSRAAGDRRQLRLLPADVRRPTQTTHAAMIPFA